MDKDNLFIYVCIYVKYDNVAMPDLAGQIAAYLLENPDRTIYNNT